MTDKHAALRETVARLIAFHLGYTWGSSALEHECFRDAADAAIAVISEDARRKALEEAALVVEGKCVKCSGEGWLWAHELELSPYPDNRCLRFDDTKYSCDGDQHEIAAAIRSLIKP